MKVVLFSTLSIFLLTGCDNFKLLENSGNKLPQFLDQGTPAPAPSRDLPTIRTLPAVPEETPDNKKNQPQSETDKPAAPAAAPAPAPSQNTESQDLPAQPAQTAPVVLPEPDAPATPAPAPAPAPTPAPAKAEAPPAPKPLVSKAPETEKEKPAAAEATEKPTVYGANTVSLNEYINYQNSLMQFLGAENKALAETPVQPAGTQNGDIKTHTSGNIQKFNISITNKDKTVTEFKDLTISLSGITAAKSGEYQFNSLCMGAKCDLLFVRIFRLDDKKIVANYPTVLKLVNNEFVTALFKKSAEYAAENNALKASGKTVKFVPQLHVIKNLSEHVGAYGDKIVEALRSDLQKSDSLAYSDLVLGARTLRMESLQPRFTKENGKLVLNAQLDFTGPKKPLIFKGEVSVDSNSAPIQADSEMAVHVKAIVKGQIFVLSFINTNFKSQIPNVTAGFQSLVCSVLEEESNFFTFCTPIEAAVIFNEEGIIEGNAKQKVRATK